MRRLASDSKKKLMGATLDLVAEVGYKNASTKRIAQAANMNESSIFRLFGSKKQLFLDSIFFMSMSSDDMDMKHVWNLTDCRQRIGAFLGQCLDLCIRQLSVNRMFVFCTMEVMDEKFQKMVLARVLQVSDTFRLFLDRERQLGEIVPTDMAILPDLVFSRLTMAAMYFYRLDSDPAEVGEHKQAFLNELADFVWEKLRVKEAC